MRVLAAIINWNNAASTIRCINSLEAQGSLDILVVDSASQNECVIQIQAVAPHVAIDVLPVNQGFVGAVNHILAKPGVLETYDYILISNNDLVFEDRCIEKLKISASARPDIAIFSPAIVMQQTGLFQRSGSEFSFWRSGSYKTFSHSSSADFSKKIPGACMFVRTASVKLVGGMNPIFYLYYGDREWQERIVEAGWKLLLLEEARVVHEGGASIGGRSSIYYYYSTRDFLEYIRLKYGAWGLIYSIPNSIVRRLFGLAPFLSRQDRVNTRYLLLAYLDFFRGKCRRPNGIGTMS